MKFIFKKSLKEAAKEALFVSMCHTNKDEIFLENGIKTLYLKRDELEKMTLRKLYLLIRKMVILAKQARAKQLAFNFNDFAFADKVAEQGSTLSALDLAEIIGTQIAFANYEFVKFLLKELIQKFKK
jgi:hypothetical protein